MYVNNPLIDIESEEKFLLNSNALYPVGSNNSIVNDQNEHEEKQPQSWNSEVQDITRFPKAPTYDLEKHQSFNPKEKHFQVDKTVDICA